MGIKGSGCSLLSLRVQAMGGGRKERPGVLRQRPQNATRYQQEQQRQARMCPEPERERPR